MHREVILRGLVLSGLLMLAACGTDRTLPSITRHSAVAIPEAQPLTLAPVSWRVVTPAQLRALADEATRRGGEQPVFFLLDRDSYETLTLNLNEITRYVGEQRNVIVFMRRVIEGRSEPAPTAGTPAR